MSYLSLRSLSVSFSLTKSVTSWAYSGALLARSSTWLTSGDEQGAEPDRDQQQGDVDERDREPALHVPRSKFTGPETAMAMNAAMTSQLSGLRSR